MLEDRCNKFIISSKNTSKRCSIYTKIINRLISAFIISENLSTLKAQPGPKYTTPIRTEFSRDSPDRGPDTLGYLTKTWGTFFVYIFLYCRQKREKREKILRSPASFLRAPQERSAHLRIGANFFSSIIWRFLNQNSHFQLFIKIISDIIIFILLSNQYFVTKKSLS